MIPKIIHYCWFSGEPMPPEVLDCIASWRRFCPDWELRLWDMDAIRDIDNRFMREALSVKKWAFAADYVRVYAVERYGGVYLDTDIKVIAPLDQLLDCSFFTGREEILAYDNSFTTGLTGHCFGGEKGHPFLRDCLTYYENQPFIYSTSPRLPDVLKYNLRIAPLIQALIAAYNYGYNSNVMADYRQDIKEGIVVYPPDVFTNNNAISQNTLTVHLCFGSWRQQNSTPTDDNFQPPAISLWRKIISRFNLRARFVRLLRRMGYVAVRVG
ncbi:MAG: hypothetical protein J1E29_01030 [Duncaniella sp.]|nr:hypothetical protein [Duncaniella sp.]